MKRLHRGLLRQSEWGRIRSAVESLADTGIQFLDHPFPRWEQIAAVAWRLKEHDNLGLIVVDSIQSVRPWPEGGGSNQCDTVGGLTQLAKHLDIPIVATTCLRNQSKEATSVPAFSDLDGTNALTGVRYILMTSRNTTSSPTNPNVNQSVTRVDMETPTGKRGPVYLQWEDDTSRFRDVSGAGKPSPESNGTTERIGPT
jgi:replicative DNA helicase